MSDTSLILDQSGRQMEAPQPQRASDLDQFIMMAATREDVSIEKLERLLVMKREIKATEQREQFFESLALVQSQMPQLEQNGLIDYGAGKGKIKYARYEDIDAVVRPLYSKYGFSVSWDSAPAFEGKMVKVTGTFSCHGHSEKREMTGPVDSSGGKNGIQGVASTVAYLKRQTLKMFFNMVERGHDKDGANPADLKPITQDQADTIRTQLVDLKADIGKFVSMLGVEKLEDIRVGQMKEVAAAIERKRRAVK